MIGRVSSSRPHATMRADRRAGAPLVSAEPAVDPERLRSWPGAIARPSRAECVLERQRTSLLVIPGGAARHLGRRRAIRARREHRGELKAGPHAGPPRVPEIANWRAAEAQQRLGTTRGASCFFAPKCRTLAGALLTAARTCILVRAAATYGAGSVEICVRGTSGAVALPSTAANRRRRTAPRS